MDRDYVVPPNPPVNGMPEDAPLYARLGGDAGLSRLIKWFYARVRYEPEVQAIFDAHVHDWPEHIRTITAFWAQVTGGPSLYAGGMGKHVFLKLGPEHFAIWLGVWERNCRELLPPREAQEMIAIADDFGLRLQRMTARPPTQQNPT